MEIMKVMYPDLTSHPSAAANPNIPAIKAFHETEFSNDSSVPFLDVADGRAVTWGGSTSKHNDRNVAVMMQIIIVMLMIVMVTTLSLPRC